MSAYTDEVIADGAVHLWLFSENAGNSTVADSIGSLTATSYSGAGTTNTSNVYNAASFPAGASSFQLQPASTEYVRIPDNNDLTAATVNTSFSVEMWVNPNNAHVGALFNKLGEWGLAWGEGGSSNQFFAFIHKTDFNGIRYKIDNTTRTSGGSTWYHVVFTWNRSTGAHILYVDGVDDSTEYVAGAVTGDGNTSSDAIIGQNNNGSYGQKFDGYIAATAIYHSVLTPTQVATHHTLGNASANDANISAAVTNIGVTGQDATVTISAVISAPVANIEVQGEDAGVSAGGSVQITTDITDIVVTGYDATIVAQRNITVSADVANIEVDAKDGSIFFTTDYELYISTLTPKHFYKFSNGATNTDSGTNPKTLQAVSGINQPISDNTNGITGNGEKYFYTYDGTRASYTGNITNGEIFFAPGTTNGVIEFWIKTTSQTSLANIFCQGYNLGDGTSTNGSYVPPPPFTGSGYSLAGAGSNTFSGRGYKFIGLQNGYLVNGYLQGGVNKVTTAEFAVVETTSGFVATGSWTHVAIVINNNSYYTYINGVIQGASLNAVANTTQATSGPSTYPFVIGEVRNRFSGPVSTRYQIMPGFIGSIDDIAVYIGTLTPEQVQTHYTYGLGIPFSPDVNIEADVANVAVNGQAATPGYGSTINAPVSNINVIGQGAIISANGAISIGAGDTHIAVTGYDATVTTTKNINIQLEDNPANIGVTTGLTGVLATVDDLTFSFAPADTIRLSAADADRLIGVNMGAFLFSQSKERRFKIANTSLFHVSYVVNTISANTGIPDAVTYSLDDETYTTSLEVPAVSPNGISPTIYMKVSISSSLQTGDGNFLINVEPTNVSS